MNETLYVFLKYRKENFIEFQNDNNIPCVIKKVIEEIRNQLTKKQIFSNRNSHKLPFIVIKTIFINKIKYNLILKFIPIFFREEDNYFYFDNLKDIEQKKKFEYINDKHKNFYKKAENYYSEKSFHNIKLLKNENYEIEYEDLLIDLLLISKIQKKVKNIRFLNKEKIIWSDQEVGIIVEELLDFVSIQGIYPQKVKYKDNSLVKIINSFIKIKFTKEYIQFLEENKDIDLCNRLLLKINNIKKELKYDKNKIWMNKRRLFNYLKNKEMKKNIKQNKILFQYLFELLTNKSGIINFNTKIQFLQMDKVWEKRVFEYLKISNEFNNEKFKEQDEKEYFKYIFNNIEKKTKVSNPDLVSNKYIIDAKYKLLNTYYLENNNEDINKLIRDLIVWNKKEGYLILLKKENIDNKYEDIFQNIGDLRIYIKEIDF